MYHFELFRDFKSNREFDISGLDLVELQQLDDHSDFLVLRLERAIKDHVIKKGIYTSVHKNNREFMHKFIQHAEQYIKLMVKLAVDGPKMERLDKDGYLALVSQIHTHERWFMAANENLSALKSAIDSTDVSEITARDLFRR